MKSIIQFSMSNKFAVWLLTVMLIVFGLYAGMTMNREVIPDIDAPVVTVSGAYPGATPEEVANEVSIPIEQAVENLDGVSAVNSSSFENFASIQIEYEFSKEMDEAEAEAKEAIEQLEFADGVEEPTVSRINFGAFPILTLSVSEEGASLTELTERVEQDIIPELEGLPGIESVTAAGQETKEVQITFDEEALAEHGLDEETVTQLLEASSMRFPLGLYTFSGEEQSVVIDGKVTTLDDLRNLQLPSIPAGGGAPEMGQLPEGGMPEGEMPQMPEGEMPDGSGPIEGQQGMEGGELTGEMPELALETIALEDVADIEVVNESNSISRTNGQTAIGIEIVKAGDANTVAVADEVKEAIASFEEDGLSLSITTDQAEPIEESVATMVNKALFGALFAVAIILLFLRNIRTTVISVISIPVSLFIALIVLQQLDITLNIMTLGAMTVAIGRVIDDSIVVVENIFRRMGSKEEKLSGRALIQDATKEVFKPILSSTIVTAVVFLPLGLVEGMVGELFLPFGLTVIFALFASLLVAITVVPMMANSLFKNGAPEKHKKQEEKPGKLASGYRRLLEAALNHKIITSLIAVALLVGSLFLTPFVGVSFLPEEEEKLVFATYSPNAGTTFEDAENDVNAAEEVLLDREGIDVFQLSLGAQSSSMAMMQAGDNSAIFYIQYEDDFEGFTQEKEAVVEALEEVTENGTWTGQDIATGGVGSSEFSVTVFGDSEEDIEPAVEDIKALLEEHDDLADPETSIADRYQEYTLKVDQERLSELGLTTAQLGMALYQVDDHNAVTTVEADGEELDVVIATNEEEYGSLEELTDVEVETQLGTQVAIADLVSVEEGTSSSTITRRDGQIYAEASAKILSDDVAGVSTTVLNEIEKLELPEGVDVQVGGVTADIEESFTQLGIAMLVAIAIVYFVLVVTFGGGLAPFAILFSLPFIVIGALVGLFVTGETISISVLIGILMLIGIVVTNAIVLIDRVIHKEKEGLSTRDALLEAGTVRLRPILMTALVTIGALIPLAIGAEGGGLISKGLGITVIGGLTSSTLLTLVIVPIVYELLMKMRRKLLRK
ncbi:efflux RND transporter permease subunit [Shouchella clausii]|uniref:efflux RND transporter permease subunit n=1 Tax=Shouchella TaxID=2893057 RepID=UPI000BA6883C|nr:efflux RND transporter permease subunit [Shouchella clausii]PAE94683.1 Swarming motility protein SwrC [Shouchella clausii]